MSAVAAPPAAPAVETLADLLARSAGQVLVLGTSKDPNAKITVLVVSPQTGRPTLAVKLPTTDAAAAAVDAERRMLRHVEAAVGDLGGVVPRILGDVEHEGRRGLVTTALAGVPMTTAYLRRGHTACPRRVGRDFALVGRWLEGFQRATAGDRAPLDMDGGVVARLRARFNGDPGLEADLERLGAIHARLGRSAVPRTAVHGDLWCGNVLVDGGAVTGVVDWEAGVPSGEPVRDLVRFAVMYALFLDRRTRPGRAVRGHRGLRRDRWGAGVDHALDGAGWFPKLVRGFLRDGLERLGADPERWRDAALAGLAEVAALTDDPGFARQVLGVFRRLVRARP
jgi:hypothetical protein